MSGCIGTKQLGTGDLFFVIYFYYKNVWDGTFFRDGRQPEAQEFFTPKIDSWILRKTNKNLMPRIRNPQ